MKQIIYYIASSIDGFISGTDDNISWFIMSGNGIDKYLADLANFDTVLMGRKTYEFGYQYGLTPGQPAYPHMAHFIFSESMTFDHPHPKVNVVRRNLIEIENIRKWPLQIFTYVAVDNLLVGY